MRYFKAIITQGHHQSPYEAVALDLPLPIVTGRTLSEVRDNLLTALQHHIDEACERQLTPSSQPLQVSQSPVGVQSERLSRGRALVFEIPEYLLTRN